MSRADKLAEAVAQFIREVSIKTLHYEDRLDQLDTLKSALRDFDASQPDPATLVRLRIRKLKGGTVWGEPTPEKDWYPADDVVCVVTFPLPKPAPVPTVEGECEHG